MVYSQTQKEPHTEIAEETYENIDSTRGHIITNDVNLNILDSIFSNNLIGQVTSVISNTGNLFIDNALFQENSVKKTETNPNGLGRGAAIRNSGNAFIQNTRFIGNSSQHGSALYNLESGKMEIINGTFTSNINTNTGSGYAYGSIYNQGELIVRDSLFENNSMGSGGAIYNEGIATIYNSHFTGNTANGQGGAITNAESGTITIYNSVFDSNNARGASAAINSTYGGNVNLIGTTIKNHTVISAEGVNYDRDNGGAMYFYGTDYERREDGSIILDENGHGNVLIPSGHLYIQDSKFLYNTVSRGGGAIYSTGYTTIINSIFEGNVASLDQDLAGTNDASTAGAFYDYNQTGMPTIIKDSIFRKNTAYTAGAIYHITGHLIIDSTLFDANSSIDIGFGGALLNGGANSYLNITNSTFSNNYAGHGGSIFNHSKNYTNITGSSFIGNEARSYGGAMYLGTHEIVKGDASTAIKNYNYISNSSFTSNTAGSGGSLYVLSEVDIIDSVFTNNSANTNGGAIFIGNDVYHSGIAAIQNTSFSGNIAGTGGAISNNGTLSVYNSIFEYNSAGTGVAIFNRGDATIHNSLFKNNISTYTSSKTYSTAAGVIDGNGDTNIFNSSFLDNFHSSANAFDSSGAVTGDGTINIIANHGLSVFSGNTSNGSSSSLIVRVGNEMHLFAGVAKETEGRIVINDSISIFNNAHLHINKETDSSFATNGVVEINDEVKHLGGHYNSEYFLNLHNGTLKLGSATVNYDFDNDGIGDGEVTSFGTISDKITFNIYGGKISTADGYIRNTNLGKLVLHNDVFLDLDIDMKNKIADTQTVSSHTKNNFGFIIQNISLINETEEKEVTVKVTDGSVNMSVSDSINVLSPIFVYSVDDANLATNGYVTLKKNTDSYSGYQPSLYAGSVFLLSGNYLSTLDTFNRLFSVAQKKSEKLSIAVVPHASAEKIYLTNGFNVFNSFYGSDIIFNFLEKYTLSVGYLGSVQEYSSIENSGNGAQLSFSYSFPFTNMFLNLGANVQGSQTSTNTSNASESFNSISGGFAVHGGHHFYFNTDILKISPSILAMYSFSHVFLDKASNNVDLDIDVLHGLSIEPKVTVDYTLKNKNIVYVFFASTFNFMTGGTVQANNISLPEMTLEHYISYGLGIKKDLLSNLKLDAKLQVFNLKRAALQADLSLLYSF